MRANDGVYDSGTIVSANTTTYTTTIPVGVTRYFDVRAALPDRRNIHDSDFLIPRSLPTNEVLATTPSAPSARTATTGAATAVASRSAGLNGTVTPNGLLTTLYFEFGTDPSLTVATQSPHVDAGAGSAPFGSGYGLSTLTASTTYYFRIVGVNSAGTTRGNIVSFTTTP
jgi:hypothetical protein